MTLKIFLFDHISLLSCNDTRKDNTLFFCIKGSTKNVFKDLLNTLLLSCFQAKDTVFCKVIIQLTYVSFKRIYFAHVLQCDEWPCAL